MNKVLRKASAICFSLSICLLTGCAPHTELDKKAIVQAIGVDYEKESYKITLQYYNQSGTGSKTQIDNSKPNVLTSEGEGSSVYAALKDAEFNCGRELMLGVNQVIILGREAAKQPLKDVIGFSESIYESSPKVMLAVSDTTASDILAIKFTEGSLSTQKLTFLMQTAGKNGYISFPTMLDILINLNSGQKSLYLPLLEAVENGSDVSEDGKTVEIKGGVLFRDGELMGDLNTEETSGLAILSGKAESTTVIVDMEDPEQPEKEPLRVAIGLFDMNTSIVPSFEEEKLVFTVTSTADGQYLDSFVSHSDEKTAETAEKLAAEQMNARMRSAAEKLLENGTDALRLQLLLKHHDYTGWLKAMDRWDELFAESEFRFHSQVSLVGTGVDS